MDYEELARKLLVSMHRLRQAKPHKMMFQTLQGETFMLQYLAQREGDVLPSEMSCDMDISSARTAAALNSLEGKGMITRRIDKSDRRRILVKLTPQGMEAAAAHEKAVFENVGSMLRRLGERDAMEYVRITGRLADLLPMDRKDRKNDMEEGQC